MRIQRAHLVLQCVCMFWEGANMSVSEPMNNEAE